MSWILGIVVLMLLVGLSSQLFTETTFFTSQLAKLAFHNNLHEVVPGRLYRSAELPEHQFAEVLRFYRIRTVIDAQWMSTKKRYSGKTEAAFVQELGVNYVRIGLLSSAIPSRETVLTILELMKDLEEPVLIHCKSGTHRTGFLSALWLFNQQPEQTELAFQQLSLKFGFVGLERWLKATFEQRPTLDAVIWEYQRFYQACGIGFREWVDSSYMARYYPIAMHDAPRITSRASTQAR